ncbi:MAG: FAD-dependent oxidoreductase [bacterium]
MFQSELLDKQRLTGSVLRLTFRKPERFSYMPGQFLSLELTDGKRKFYSLASHPSDDTIVLLVKLAPNGIASQLFVNAKSKDMFTFSGHFGCFTPQQTDVPILMIATGVGIAPLLAHLKEYELQKHTQPIELWWGVKNQQSLIMEKELRQFTKTLPNFSYSIHYSKEEAVNLSSPYFHGRVTYQLTATVEQYQDYYFYLCGIPQMVIDCLTILRQAGIPDSHIFQEHFNATLR